jgi:hypothetical protein
METTMSSLTAQRPTTANATIEFTDLQGAISVLPTGQPAHQLYKFGEWSDELVSHRIGGKTVTDTKRVIADRVIERDAFIAQCGELNSDSQLEYITTSGKNLAKLAEFLADKAVAVKYRVAYNTGNQPTLAGFRAVVVRITPAAQSNEEVDF